MKKYKVIHVITRMILGGAQENTLLSVLGLKKLGWDVSLITGPAIGPEGSLLEHAKNEDVNYEIISEMRREINPINDLISTFKLYKLFKKKRPHIVHTHSSKAGIIGRIAAHFADVPIIVHSIHGLPFHKYEKKYLNFIYKSIEGLCGGLSDKIISVADAMTQEAQKAGISCNKGFVTIYSGMEIDRFINAGKDRNLIRTELGINKGDKLIGVVSRLFHLKGHSDIIEIAPKILNEIPNAKFVFVGDGILKEDIVLKIKEKNIHNKFIFTGLVSTDKIPGLMSAMDILVHPSLREGLPRTIPQALLAGTPAVSYDLDGAPEVIENGETGYLVEPKNTEKLSEAIIKILKNSELSEKMSKKGREKCRKMFDDIYMSRCIENEYEKLLRI